MRDGLLQMVAHRCHFRRVVIREPMARDLRGLAQADDAGQILGSSTTLALVAAAIEQRLNQSSLLEEQCSGSLRRMEFVSGDAERIETDLAHLDPPFASSLPPVRVTEHLCLLR